MITLRPDQARVAEYRQGYMAVPAVPGAGKTTVLAWLVADLIATGATEPGRALVVTYTNSGAGNLRNRIAGFLSERGYPRGQGYEVRTIHSLAMHIVRERPELLLWSDGFSIADEERQRSLLQGITRAWLQKHRPLWEPVLRESRNPQRRQKDEDDWGRAAGDLFGHLIQALKARRLDAGAAVALTAGLPPESFLRWAAAVYGEYQRALDAQGLVDFGDLVVGACRLVDEDPLLLERLQRRWTYVFEDEAQDSYRLQGALLEHLAGPGGNLVRVGDANQAIMGTFTTAEPELFRRFCRRPGVAVRPLTMAARSSQDVIDLANELVRWVREEHPEPGCREALEDQRIEPVPAAAGGGNPVAERYTIACRTRGTPAEEMDLLVRSAASYVQRNPEATVALLLPRNEQLAEAQQLLSDRGVVARPLRSDPRRRQSIEDLLAILEFLAAPHQGERLNAVLCRLLGITAPAEASFTAFVRECRPEELFYPLDGSAPFTDLHAAVAECRGWIELDDALARLRRWLPYAVLPADELLLQVVTDLNLTPEGQALAQYMALRARLFLLDNPAFGLPEVTGELKADYMALNRFVDDIFDRRGFKAEPGVVYVATRHSAKGLEWETVYAGAITPYEFPARLSDRIRSELWFLRPEVINPEALAMAELARCLGEGSATDPAELAKQEIIAERLRLLYVMITRARVNLLLTAHRSNRFGDETGPAVPFLALQRFTEARSDG